MRHLYSALIGLALAPFIWTLTAWSTYRFGAVTRSVNTLSELDKPGTALIVPLLLLGIAGALIGVLLGTHLSPIGPGLAGVSILAGASAFLIKTDTMLRAVETLPGQHDLVIVLPAAAGSAFLLGTALLVPLFSTTRWRYEPPATASDSSSLETSTSEPQSVDSTKPGVSKPADSQRSAPPGTGGATESSGEEFLPGRTSSRTAGRVPAPRTPEADGPDHAGAQPARESAPETTSTGRHRALTDRDLARADHGDTSPEPRTSSRAKSAPANAASDPLDDRVGADVPRRRRHRETEPIPHLAEPRAVPGQPRSQQRLDDTLTRYTVLSPETAPTMRAND